MTDPDVVVRAAKIMGAYKVTEYRGATDKHKTVYRAVLYGKRAMEWMMTLYVLMGDRRQEKIRDCIHSWLERPARNYPERKSYSRGANVIWQAVGG